MEVNIQGRSSGTLVMGTPLLLRLVSKVMRTRQDERLFSTSTGRLFVELLAIDGHIGLQKVAVDGALGSHEHPDVEAFQGAELSKLLLVDQAYCLQPLKKTNSVAYVG